MFEITPRDIAQLDDQQLRTLVGLLCEAEMRRHGYSAAAVTWGGDQSANDGGVDVRVSLTGGDPIDGFIPRPATGFQVKATDMPPSAIAGEMCPDGNLRPIIHELAEHNGAYIIVSSMGTTADSALANRRKAMTEAAKGLAGKLALDFYDRTRLATWVRGHAGLIIWVRSQIGRSLQGWAPFGAWAYPAGGQDAEYLLENGVRVSWRGGRCDRDFSAEEGLEKIRDILRVPTSVVRLVGLSGVGKTRFVQALFDSRVGNRSLDPALVAYTNMNNEPNPPPFSLASDLVATGARAILIIDNCAPDLHARLASLAKDIKSSLSVLTVEYDIREDQTEGTEVFELQVAPTDLIERLLQSRFPLLSQVDVRSAADFSGGNARIAIALADTVGRGGTLATLSNVELFERLFMQRREHDRSLLQTAQACALVYSFDGEDTSNGDGAELFRIARMIDTTVYDVHRNVAELLRRDLAQRRGKWRAVLPHALANRLAETALQNIPLARIHECLIDGAPTRLTISFSRRLGYLTDSEEAIAIARDWLCPKGYVGTHIWNLNEFGRAMFINSLPACPEAGLRAIESNLPLYDAKTPITTGDYIPQALRSLAWDPSLFERCADLLQILAIYGEGAIATESTEIYVSLFRLYLSGTRATVEQRVAIAKRLLRSTSVNEVSLGAAALNAMLQTAQFSSSYNFHFGGRSRDYGYQPRTYGDQTHWYKTTFAVAEAFALSSCVAAGAVKAIVAANFRGLWTRVGLHDELEAISARLAEQGFWKDGWLAVKDTRFYDEKDKASRNYAQLSKLEELLRPRGLVERVRGRVFNPRPLYDVDEGDSDDGADIRLAVEQQQAEIELLGDEVAGNVEALRDLLPEIVQGEGHLWHFGIGLARGARDPRQLWYAMVGHFVATLPENRDSRVLCGFLRELDRINAPLADELLSEAIKSEPLSHYFPVLQGSVIVTRRGIARLRKSLELAKAPASVYSDILLGRAVEVVPAADIAAYIMALANAPEGEPVAIRVLSMQFFGDRQAKRSHAPEIVRVGQKILQQMNFDRTNRLDDYHVKAVVEVSLAGARGSEAAKVVCGNLVRAITEHRTYGFDRLEILKALFEAQPRAALDAFLAADDKTIMACKGLIDLSSRFQPNPIDEVKERILFEWCSEDPAKRFMAAASVVSIFMLSANQNPVAWNPITSRLVYSSPDPIAVMRVLVSRLRPTVWSGARSSILETNAKLLDQFDVQGNAELALFIAGQKADLQREARESLAWETKLDSQQDERFE